MAALLDAVQAISTLDQQLYRHPLVPAWARVERDLAVAAAAATAGPGSADVELIFRARLGLIALPRGYVALGDLDSRARAWEAVRQRKGVADRRALVGALATRRGTRDLVGLADAIAAMLADVSTASWQLTRAGQGYRTVTVASGSAVDSDDVALAVPYALRRLGLTRSLLPALSGGIRALQVGDAFVTHDDGPHAAALAPLTVWATPLGQQARAGSARLHRLERYVADVERQLILVRRLHALRRLVGVGLTSWGLWAAQLARLTDVELSSAWRTLAHAAELGIVEAVPPSSSGADGLPGTGLPGTGRSRGDAMLYAIPPWLRLAGLSAAPRGRPAGPVSARNLAGWPAVGEHNGFAATAAAMDEAAAIAHLDALLARRSNSV